MKVKNAEEYRGSITRSGLVAYEKRRLREDRLEEQMMYVHVKSGNCPRGRDVTSEHFIFRRTLYYLITP